MMALRTLPWRALIGFQLCWFALVSLQQQAVIPVLLYLGYGLWRLGRNARTAVLITFIAGICIDTLLLQTKVLQFSAGATMPLWFVLLWGAFALAAVEFMAMWLTRLVHAAVLGGFGGPLSYWGGAALSDGALQFPLGAVSLGVLICVWALLAIVLGKSRRWYVNAV
jgi:hypothetical protein